MKNKIEKIKDFVKQNWIAVSIIGIIAIISTILTFYEGYAVYHIRKDVQEIKNHLIK